MRSYSPAEIAHLQARAGVRARLLVWICARNRTTGTMETMGFWNGDDAQTFTIGGGSRVYQGIGALLGMDDLTVEVGLQVRRISVWLATAAPEVLSAVRQYDLRMAPIEIHRVLTDPQSHQLIADPHRIWKGLCDGQPVEMPAMGTGGGRITLTVSSAAIALTRTLNSKFSDEALKRRGGDRLARYADITGKVGVWWGEKRYEAKETSTPVKKDKS
jgi:hypothetical protein